MAPFTPKSTSKLRSAQHFRYLIVIPCFILIANIASFKNPQLNPNNLYNHGFHNTFDYNHFMCSDYLPYTVTASAHIMPWPVFVALL